MGSKKTVVDDELTRHRIPAPRVLGIPNVMENLPANVDYHAEPRFKAILCPVGKHLGVAQAGVRHLHADGTIARGQPQVTIGLFRADASGVARQAALIHPLAAFPPHGRCSVLMQDEDSVRSLPRAQQSRRALGRPLQPRHGGPDAVAFYDHHAVRRREQQLRRHAIRGRLRQREQPEALAEVGRDGLQDGRAGLGVGG